MNQTQTAAAIAEVLKHELSHADEVDNLDPNALGLLIAQRLYARAKAEALTNAIALGPTLVHIDARRADVPPHLANEMNLPLRLGYGLNPPITDLTIDDDGWSATLSFQGALFTVWAPWSSVFGVRTEQGGEIMGWWMDSVPPEMIERVARAVTSATTEPPAKPAKKARVSHLALVPEESQPDPELRVYAAPGSLQAVDGIAERAPRPFHPNCGKLVKCDECARADEPDDPDDPEDRGVGRGGV